MSTTTAVPLDEYLHTEYEPDCDYVDGVLEPRNVGPQDHGETQAIIAGYFVRLKKRLRIRVATELRMRVSATRIRTPDVAIVHEDDRDQVKQNPPLLVIEVLSPDDRFSKLLQRVDEYLAFGVPVIWIVDPYEKTAWIVTQETPKPYQVDQLRWNDVTIDLRDLLPEQ